ncbi:MAG: aromatic ring-hydroxylating dioxygenase subunit alpha [Woeseiaceae bacterium]|nr:aromatic ring-hydroxylating dioxygenase subunit alpha [Woeseiaceae bacterium]
MSTRRKPGSARSEGPSYQDYLARDSKPAPKALAEEHARYLGSEPLAASRYTSLEFFALEAERLWPRVWQMACREEDIPEVGDVCVYDIVGKSFLVTRTSANEIRAFYNVCLHRGRKLRTESGQTEDFRCPFHGFTWHLDGSIKSVPCRWDFEHLSDERLQLPEAKVETWGGFVFLNMDPDAPPLLEFLDPLPAHFERWRLEDCYKAAHVAKVIRCNWKVAMEAFMESYHVIATHPQILPVIADANSQYDILGRHVNRNLTAFAAPSPHLGEGVSDEEVLRGMLSLWSKPGSADKLVAGNANTEPRRVLGSLNRDAFTRAYGGDYSAVSDAETLDALVYNVFPNFSPWAGFAPNIVYRWRPHGSSVGECTMEVMILKRMAEGEGRPRGVPVHWLDVDTPWSAAAELPILGPVIDQDMSNMPFVQEGLVSSANDEVQLGNYQEIRIRHFHRTLDEYLAD